MAKGKRCPICGHYMFAQHEQHQEKGTWVTYVCRNSTCGHTEKVFEAS